MTSETRARAGELADAALGLPDADLRTVAWASFRDLSEEQLKEFAWQAWFDYVRLRARQHRRAISPSSDIDALGLARVYVTDPAPRWEHLMNMTLDGVEHVAATYRERAHANGQQARRYEQLAVEMRRRRQTVVGGLGIERVAAILGGDEPPPALAEAA